MKQLEDSTYLGPGLLKNNIPKFFWYILYYRKKRLVIQWFVPAIVFWKMIFELLYWKCNKKCNKMKRYQQWSNENNQNFLIFFLIKIKNLFFWPKVVKQTEAGLRDILCYLMTVLMFIFWKCLTFMVVYDRATWTIFRPILKKQEKSTPTKSLIFQKMELFSSRIKKFQEGTFHAQKIKKTTLKKFLIIWEMEFSRLELEKLLIFQEGTCKTNKKILSKNMSCFFWRFHNLYSRKQRQTSCESKIQRRDIEL